MGGLVSFQAAQLVAPDLLIVIEPSAPAETQRRILESELATGSFDPEEVYGIVVGDSARAYPISMIAYHHVINDTVAGRHVAVTY